MEDWRQWEQELADLEAWAKSWAWYTPISDFITGNYFFGFGLVWTVTVLVISCMFIASFLYCCCPNCFCCCCRKVKNCMRRRRAQRTAEREVRQDEEIDREIRVARNVVAALAAVQQDQSRVNRAPRPHRGRRQGERDMVSLPMLTWLGSDI